MVPGAKRSNPAKPGSPEETLAFRPGSFILGIREGHGITTGRAVVSVLLPLIVAIAIFIAILFPLFFRSIEFFGGVRI